MYARQGLMLGQPKIIGIHFIASGLMTSDSSTYGENPCGHIA